MKPGPSHAKSAAEAPAEQVVILGFELEPSLAHDGCALPKVETLGRDVPFGGLPLELGNSDPLGKPPDGVQESCSDPFASSCLRDEQAVEVQEGSS